MSDMSVPPTTGEPIATVTAFLAELERLDIESALKYAAPSIEYQNVPLPPARGREAFAKQMNAMGTVGTGFQARVHQVAANGPIVLTERTDVLEAGSFRAEFWVCGTFEVHEGRIVLWRDYFDWTTVFASSVRGAGRAAMAGLSKLVSRS